MNRFAPIEGSDFSAIEPVGGVLYVAGFIRNPRQMISIRWEVNNPAGSGSTECEAWEGQHQIDNLTRAGFRVVCVNLI